MNPNNNINNNNNINKHNFPPPLFFQHPPLISPQGLNSNRNNGAIGNNPNNVSGQHHTVAEFLYQLTKMLTDRQNRNIIEWSKGKIEVHDPPRLANEVLHKYFRHSKYASFQRQLNYFGFRKLAGKGKMSPCSYVNEDTTDDLRSLLLIKRKTSSASSSANNNAKRSSTVNNVNAINSVGLSRQPQILSNIKNGAGVLVPPAPAATIGRIGGASYPTGVPLASLAGTSFISKGLVETNFNSTLKTTTANNNSKTYAKAAVGKGVIHQQPFSSSALSGVNNGSGVTVSTNNIASSQCSSTGPIHDTVSSKVAETEKPSLTSAKSMIQDRPKLESSSSVPSVVSLGTEKTDNGLSHSTSMASFSGFNPLLDSSAYNLSSNSLVAMLEPLIDDKLGDSTAFMASRENSQVNLLSQNNQASLNTLSGMNSNNSANKSKVPRISRDASLIDLAMIPTIGGNHNPMNTPAQNSDGSQTNNTDSGKPFDFVDFPDFR